MVEVHSPQLVAILQLLFVSLPVRKRIAPFSTLGIHTIPSIIISTTGLSISRDSIPVGGLLLFSVLLMVSNLFYCTTSMALVTQPS